MGKAVCGVSVCVCAPNLSPLFPSLHSSLQLPTTISDNAGFDSSDLMTCLRAAHSKGSSSAGIGRRWM